MPTNVRPVPEGHHSVTPYLIVRGAAKAIEFYKSVFGAVETVRMDMGGRIGHAQVMIGDSQVMLADEFPEMGAKGPEAFGGSPVSLLVYVEDVDAVVARAVAAGAKLARPIEDKFYGDRAGGIEDPFGHSWTVATHKEDVPPEEMKRRMQAFMTRSRG